MNDPNPQEPKIVVDDDWKSQVQQEKEKAKEEPAPTPDEQANDGIPPASFPLLVSTLASQALSGLGQSRTQLKIGRSSDWIWPST